MKIAINRDYGSFSYRLPREYQEMKRTDPRLIKYIEEEWPKDDKVVATIPEEATDYHLEEYDGLESIIYVIDGKLWWTNGEKSHRLEQVDI